MGHGAKTQLSPQKQFVSLFLNLLFHFYFLHFIQSSFILHLFSKININFNFCVLFFFFVNIAHFLYVYLLFICVVLSLNIHNSLSFWTWLYQTEVSHSIREILRKREKKKINRASPPPPNNLLKSWKLKYNLILVSNLSILRRTKEGYAHPEDRWTSMSRR